MATKSEAFERLLTKLNEVQGVEGSMIVTRGGEIIAVNIGKGYAADKIAALTSNALETVLKVVKELDHGVPRLATIESARGKFAIVNAEKANVFIIGVGNESANVGMFKMALDEALQSYYDEQG